MLSQHGGHAPVMSCACCSIVHHDAACNAMHCNLDTFTLQAVVHYSWRQHQPCNLYRTAAHICFSLALQCLTTSRALQRCQSTLLVTTVTMLHCQLLAGALAKLPRRQQATAAQQCMLHAPCQTTIRYAPCSKEQRC